MKSLLWLLAVFAAAVALVVLGRIHAGYVVFVYPPYRVEASLLLLAVGLLLSFVLLYAVARLLGQTIGLPASIRAFRARRRRERAHAALSTALHAYYEGHYAKAEKQAALAFERGPVPGLAALLAARAAHQMREFDKRERWLEQAEATGAPVRTAALVTRAELALEERDFARARDALREVSESRRKPLAATRMLLRAERGAGAWDEVLRLLGPLSRQEAIAPALADEYRIQATVELLARSADEQASFERRWRGVPSRDQVHPRVAAAAARHATALGNAALAGEILQKALAAEWTPELVALYGELPAEMEPEARAAQARSRIERAERWLLERERDAKLLATLGRLCAHAELWGKARSFLEASLSFEETRAAHLDLARLAERVGQADDAQRHFRRAAELA